MKFKKFTDIIEKLGVGAHNKRFELRSGDLNVPPEVFSDFLRLFDAHGTKKNVGNGEVAAYWLFDRRYGGIYDVSCPGRRGGSDLLIDGKNVEVKSSERGLSTATFKMGKFEELHELRQVLNVVLGAYNVFAAGKSEGDKHGDRTYLSESSLGVNGLTRAFRSAVQSRHAASNIERALEDPMFQACQEPEEYAVRLLAALAAAKLGRKIGPGGYVVNVNPVRIGLVEVFQVNDLTSYDPEVVRAGGIRINCSELHVNLGIFKRNGEGNASVS